MTKVIGRRHEKPIVFVVDDVPESREPIVVALWEAGYEVVAAASSKTALDLLHHGLQPDVFLVSLAAHGSAGWDVWHHRQATPALHAIPTAAMISGAADAVVAGAVIVKLPADATAVVAAVRQARPPSELPTGG